jgi:23S rRNA (uridine2552-2'-O)-methyltransferase
LPKQWLRARKQDYFYQKAKTERFRSRAAYKLLEAVKKYKFLDEGNVIVDLGAAPGSWLQVSGKIVGDQGFVLGVDLNPIRPLETNNIQTTLEDIRDPGALRRIKKLLPSPADAVLSDVAPNTTGAWEVDHARQIELANCSLEIASHLLRPYGSFFVKVFQGDMFNAYFEKAKRRFRRVEILKPQASRRRSAEIFVLGMGFRRTPANSGVT